MYKQHRTAGHKTSKKSKEEAEDGNGIALAEVDESNGNCNQCGKKGHKEIDCWSKHPEKHPSRNGQIKCNSCIKIVHKESDCWDKHPGKGQDWYKDKSDPSGVAVKLVEILVTTIEGVIVERENLSFIDLIFFRRKRPIGYQR